MNTPALKKTLLLALISLSAALPTEAAAKIFARGSTWQTDHTNSELTDSTDTAIAAGVLLGAAEHHEIGVEAAQNYWAWTRPYGLIPLHWEGKGKSKLLLASYRYYIGKSDWFVRVYLGGSVGAAKIEGDIAYNGSGVKWLGTADKTQAAFGGTAGVTLRLCSHAHIDLGYRYNNVRGFDATVSAFGTGTATRQIDFPETTARIFHAGVRVSF